MRTSNFIFLLLLMVGVACKSTQKPTQISTVPSSPVLLDFAKEDVTKAEFERVYQKNNGGYDAVKTHTEEQLREYLDLYVKFKRKVFEAEAQKLDTTPAFKNEFETYRKQLAQPYLTAKEVEDRLIKEAYDRTRYVVNASHLLLKLDENALPADTLAAYTKIMGYRDSVLTGGKPFAKMAEKYSEDPSARQNQGSLGYFSAFDMVYPFETGAFETPVGKISMPIRSSFGYHIIKVNDKLATGGIKRAAHIIIRIGDRFSAKDTAQALAKINEIHQKLVAGEEFAVLAKQYSDDPSSASRGGDLGSGRLLTEMQEAKLKLKKDQFSKPFQTKFGWHIMKVTEVEAEKSFEETQYELKRKVERDSRAKISQQALIDRIKGEYGYQLAEENFNKFKEIISPNFPRGTWIAEDTFANIYALPLMTLSKDETYTCTVQNLIDFYTKNRPQYNNLNPIQAADQVLKLFVNAELTSYEESKLPEKNPEYRYLLKEYRDGILLFTLMEQMVWKKAVEDTVGLKEFYESNRTDFVANRTIDIREYRSSDGDVIKDVERLLNLNATDAEIDSLVERESSLGLTMRTLTYEEGKSEIDQSLFAKEVGHVSPVIMTGDEHKIIKVLEIRPAGIQPFDRVKSEAITKYQDYLEKEWLKDLEYKFPVKIDESVFSNLFK